MFLFFPLIIFDIIVASLPTTAFEASISYQMLDNSLFFKNLDIIAGLILYIVIKSIIGLKFKNPLF